MKTRLKTRRLYAFLYERPIHSLALLPRLRLCIDDSFGFGVAWLTAWLHVWLWFRKPHAPVRRAVMIEVLPHLWLHWDRRFGVGVHIEWIRWRAHVWLYRPPEERRRRA